MLFVLLLGSGVHLGFLLFYLIVVDIFVVGHHLVDGSAWRQFDDPVGDRLDKLMVMA